MIFVIHCTKVQTFMPFLGDRPWNFAHVFDAPLPSLLRMNRVLFSFFSLETWDPLRPKYPKNTKPKYLAKKTKKMQKARQGRITVSTCVCKSSVSYLSKTAWTLIGLWRVLGLYAAGYMLEPACTTYQTLRAIKMKARTGGKGRHLWPRLLSRRSLRVKPPTSCELEMKVKRLKKQQQKTLQKDALWPGNESKVIEKRKKTSQKDARASDIRVRVVYSLDLSYHSQRTAAGSCCCGIQSLVH